MSNKSFSLNAHVRIYGTYIKKKNLFLSIPGTPRTRIKVSRCQIVLKSVKQFSRHIDRGTFEFIILSMEFDGAFYNLPNYIQSS